MSGLAVNKRICCLIILTLLSTVTLTAKESPVTVVDSLSKLPVGGASIFDNRGNFIDVTDNSGRMPLISPESYPLTIRCIGYESLVVEEPTKKVGLVRNVYSLPEVTVLEGKDVYVHLLGYVREYSVLSTYNDSINLFREKWVDFMIPTNPDSKFKGWSSPRILSTKSYYHYTNIYGLDSVADRSQHHFSWSDWIGVKDRIPLPESLRKSEAGVDSVEGHYNWKEIWERSDKRINISVDVLADTTNLSWIPNTSGFFKGNIDFDMFKLRYVYSDNDSAKLNVSDLQAISFNIDSRGRGRNMFMFNPVGMPFFVQTYGEIYIADKEYIRKKDAKKWQDYKFDEEIFEEIGLPADVPPLSEDTRNLIARVENINHIDRQLMIKPDPILIGPERKKLNTGQKILHFLNNLRKTVYVRSPKMNTQKMKRKN